MKKIFILFSALTLVLSSCTTSSTDTIPDPTTPTSGVLPTKTITTQSGYVITINYKYNGNKIVSGISNSGDYGTNLFTYTGNLITKRETFLGTTLTKKTTFEYNSSEQLTKSVSVDYTSSKPYGIKYTFVYNSDGTTSFSKFLGNDVDQTTLDLTGTAYYTNGEITKVDKILTPTNTYVRTYTNDTKNNPFKNITGYSKIAFADSHSLGFMHNVLTETSSSQNITSTYTYNSLDYPTNVSTVNVMTSPFPGTVTSTTQFFY
jgi:hypothetical protein